VGKSKWFWGFARSISQKCHTERRDDNRRENSLENHSYRWDLKILSINVSLVHSRVQANAIDLQLIDFKYLVDLFSHGIDYKNCDSKVKICNFYLYLVL